MTFYRNAVIFKVSFKAYSQGKETRLFYVENNQAEKMEKNNDHFSTGLWLTIL